MSLWVILLIKTIGSVSDEDPDNKTPEQRAKLPDLLSIRECAWFVKELITMNVRQKRVRRLISQIRFTHHDLSFHCSDMLLVMPTSGIEALLLLYGLYTALEY
jgi:hypothetical protein